MYTRAGLSAVQSSSTFVSFLRQSRTVSPFSNPTPYSKKYRYSYVVTVGRLPVPVQKRRELTMLRCGTVGPYGTVLVLTVSTCARISNESKILCWYRSTGRLLYPVPGTLERLCRRAPRLPGTSTNSCDERYACMYVP
jgi:hypothetical protein